MFNFLYPCFYGSFLFFFNFYSEFDAFSLLFKPLANANSCSFFSALSRAAYAFASAFLRAALAFASASDCVFYCSFRLRSRAFCYSFCASLALLSSLTCLSDRPRCPAAHGGGPPSWTQPFKDKSKNPIGEA